MDTERHQRDVLRAVIADMYTPKQPLPDGKRVFIIGMWGTIVGFRYESDNPVDPIYVVRFDNGSANAHVPHFACAQQ